MWIVALSIGLLTGIPLVEEIGWRRVLEIVGLISAYFIGYAFFRNLEDKQILLQVLAISSLLYVAVCVMALTKIAPSVFPLEILIWSDSGILRERPAVMTDQNFQVFYLFPTVLCLVLQRTKIGLLITTIGLALSFYILANLQTRSGILIMAGLIVLTVYAQKRSKRGTQLLAVLGVALAGAMILVALWKLPSFELLLTRFSSGDYATAQGRLSSFTYLFEKLWNPLNWLPIGNSEFLKLTGNRPHSNPTALFLEGGLIALFAWGALVLHPAWKLGLLYLRGRLDQLSQVCLLGGVGSLVAQLALNVPVMDQVWLWAGALGGRLVKVMEHQKIRKGERAA